MLSTTVMNLSQVCTQEDWDSGTGSVSYVSWHLRYPIRIGCAFPSQSSRWKMNRRIYIFQKRVLTSDNIGIILSSFYWGYAVVQVPLGHVARIWSAKTVLGIGMLISGIGSILSPIIFDNGHWIYFVACRITIGIGQAGLLPCTHTLLSKWVPPSERGRLGTLTYVGGQFGTVITYPITGALIDAADWRSVFYCFGAAAVLWSFIIFFVGSDSPAASSGKSCCRINNAERKYIESSLGVFGGRGGITADEEKDSNNSTPWKAILTSPPFWALLVAHCGQNWGFSMLLTEIPNYMAGVLGFNIQENGIASALPYVALLILTFPVSWLSDWSERKGVSRGVSRKVCNSIGHWGPALALVGICFVSPGDTTVPVVLLVLAVALNIGAICGFQINHMDLSLKYAGLLASITNSAASVVSLLAPLVVGKIVTESKNAAQWAIVFYMSAGIYFLANLIFILFGSGESQWWNDSENSSDMNCEEVLRRRASSLGPAEAVVF
ncbi:putative inorganic phosphate cotransporter isoform X2 [Diachasmimorpha longicaudata]|uniref:putative inorganic phosphate cotransporter isoform X2 n=1 Tax=Diachasmimorpha longicaudata TaxID=58733 RepID=UPI0030B87B62